MAGILILLAGTGVTAWYFHASPGAVRGADVEFVPDGAWLTLPYPARLRHVRVEGREGVIVSRKSGGVEKERLWLVFDWEAGRDYTFTVSTEEGTIVVEKSAPAHDYTAGVQLSVPFTSMAGLTSPAIFEKQTAAPGTAIENNELTSALIVTAYRQGERTVTGRVIIPAGVKLTAFPQNRDTKTTYDERGTVIHFRTTLSVAYERFYMPFSIRMPDKGEYRLRAEVTLRGADGRESLFSRAVTVKVVGKESLADTIRLIRVSMPAGIQGIALRQYAADTLYIQPRVFKKLGRFFGIEPKYIDYTHPFTYQGLVLENTGTGSIALLINSAVYYRDRDIVPAAFRPPDSMTGGTKDAAVTVTAVLPPGEKTRVVLPVYVTSDPLPGEYRRVVRLIMMGTVSPVAEYEFPLYVTSMNLTAWTFTLIAVFLSLTATLVFIIRFKKIVARMKVRWLVIISLYGAMTFVVSNVPVRIFGSFVSAVMGPFSVFITGFFSSLLYWTLLVSLVRLLPRPGTVTFATLVRYMLNGIMFGGFQLADILFTGTGIVAKEAAFYVSGLTRRGEGFKWNTGSVLYLAVCLSLADAFITLTGLYLHMVLYRLYFADWYIYLNVIINSLLYTSAATFTGRRFSDRLKWEDG
ncbi:MAG: hypothetical protein GXP46_12085 [Deferribacteres bacterium]|nr:hypothetical protein [Deferribacteres bacterium]